MTMANVPKLNVTPSDVYYHLMDLGGLLDTVCSVLAEMDYARQDGTRIDELDQVYRMSRIAQRETQRITEAASFLDMPSIEKAVAAALSYAEGSHK
jgi:hypothetical protein